MARRYKAVVEGELPEYYGSLVDYIHLNPVRSGIVNGERGQSVLDYRWSSLSGGYAAVEECEEKNPEGNVAVHRAGS